MGCLKSLIALPMLILVLRQGTETRGQLEECDLSKIQVSVSRTGFVVEGHREYGVTISNVCWCPQSNLTLACPRFQTAEPLDPSVLAAVPNSSVFLVNQGNALENGRPVSFRYAWSERFRFSPVASNINC